MPNILAGGSKIKKKKNRMSFIDPSCSLFVYVYEANRERKVMRGRMENRVVKSERGGDKRCVNAGGPYRSESAGSSSTEQQMKTDYTAVKKHMKGSAGNSLTGSHLPLCDH